MPPLHKYLRRKTDSSNHNQNKNYTKFTIDLVLASTLYDHMRGESCIIALMQPYYGYRYQWIHSYPFLLYSLESDDTEKYILTLEILHQDNFWRFDRAVSKKVGPKNFFFLQTAISNFKLQTGHKDSL